jgi:hypothetical protein
MVSVRKDLIFLVIEDHTGPKDKIFDSILIDRLRFIVSVFLFMQTFPARAALILVLFVLFPTPPAHGRKAYLSDIAITRGRDHFLLFLKATDCFTGEMEKAIENGISTTFNFFVILSEVRDLWWDKEIREIKVSHEIQYDSLKRLYRIRLSEKENKVIMVDDLEEAKRLMSEIKALALAEIQDLEKGRVYEVRMMAQLDKIRLPLYLHYVFFFLSLWDFETDWYAREFRH